MTVFKLKKGLDIPILGKPAQKISPARPVTSLALLSRDYPGLKPTMAVREGEEVKGGQLLFTDKKNPGVNFTAPGGGVIAAINRGPKRLFESIVIQLNGQEEELSFTIPTTDDGSAIRALMLESGLWTAFRSRPHGRIPSPGTKPHSIFVTAIDTQPLAPDPALIINQRQENFKRGLKLLQSLAPAVHLCLKTAADDYITSLTDIKVHEFHGPHPAGLPSTHIHFVDPIGKDKTIWHIGYQDVIALGRLGQSGRLHNERIIAIAGPAARKPRLLKTRLGANLAELCQNEFSHAARVVSGSLLNGYTATDKKEAYLGRYHLQVCALQDDAGRGLLNWLRPGRNRYSCRGLFLSSFLPRREFAMSTAAWGGRRAIFPLGTYEQVMPLDIIPTALLKALANEDTEKARELGCLELIEEDLALCSFVCPGKNNFGPMLRRVLDRIFDEG